MVLPERFELTDERWDKIWDQHKEVYRSIDHEELLALFPDEPTLKR